MGPRRTIRKQLTIPCIRCTALRVGSRFIGPCQKSQFSNYCLAVDEADMMGDRPPFGGRTGFCPESLILIPILCCDGVPRVWHGVFDPYGRFASTARRVRKPEPHATTSRPTGRTRMVVPSRLNTRPWRPELVFGPPKRPARPDGKARLIGLYALKSTFGVVTERPPLNAPRESVLAG
jgi:hypothetical protein